MKTPITTNPRYKFICQRKVNKGILNIYVLDNDFITADYYKYYGNGEYAEYSNSVLLRTPELTPDYKKNTEKLTWISCERGEMPYIKKDICKKW